MDTTWYIHTVKVFPKPKQLQHAAPQSYSHHLSMCEYLKPTLLAELVLAIIRTWAISSSHSPSDLYITFILQLHLYIRHLHFPYMPLPILLSIQMIREILGDDWRMSWLYLGGHFQKGLPNEVTSAQNVARCVDRLQEEKGRIQWAHGSSSPFLRCLLSLLPLLGGCMFHL